MHLVKVVALPWKFSTSAIDWGSSTVLFVFIEISQAEKVEKLVKFTLRVRVPPAAGRVCSSGTIERHGAPNGQGPGFGPPP